MQSSLHQYRLGTGQRASSSAEKSWASWWAANWTCPPCALTAMKAKDTLGWIRKQAARWLKIVVTPFCLALLRPHLEYVFSFTDTKHMCMNQSKSRIGASKVGRCLDHMSCEESLKELGLFSLKKEMPRRDIIVFKPLRGLQQWWRQIFPRVAQWRIRINSLKLQQGKFDWT